MMHASKEHKEDLLPRPGRRGRPMRTVEGLPLVKRLTFKVVQPSGKVSVMKHVAPAGNGFSEVNVDAALEDFAKLLAITFPKHDFRMVEISRTQFNFICCGEHAYEQIRAAQIDDLASKPEAPEYETLGQLAAPARLVPSAAQEA